ncbi:hypothetical protein OAO19_02955 [Gammaproteobacteria bacterium]|nr:hypothetical protein [Gammaproteobacteria bacterium]
MIIRTRDTNLVRSILGSEGLKEKVLGDYPVEIFDPENQDSIYYLLAVNDERKPVGLMVCHGVDNPAMYQIHINYLKKYWGTPLTNYSIEASKWMFNNTVCEKLIGFIPDSYPLVKRHALRCGYEEEGYLKKSVRVHGKLDNATIVGLCK